MAKVSWVVIDSAAHCILPIRKTPSVSFLREQLCLNMSVFVFALWHPLIHSSSGCFNRLPAAGNVNYNGSSWNTNNVGSNGNYWSSTGNNADNAYNLNFNSSNINPANNNNRHNGNSVRLVQHQWRNVIFQDFFISFNKWLCKESFGACDECIPLLEAYHNNVHGHYVI